MAIKPVDIVAPQQRVTETKGKKGGGALGGTIGGVVGGVAGAVAGGLTTGPAGAVQGGITGAAAGHSVGSVIGNAISPAQAAKQAIERRATAMSGPQIQSSPESEKLKASIMALHTQPPEVQQQYAPTLVDGYVTSLAKANPKGGQGWA